MKNECKCAIRKTKLSFLFVIPPYFDAKDFMSGSGNFLPAFTVPYGILSLVTYLDSKIGENIDFDILDLNITLKDCIERGVSYEDNFKEAIQSKCNGKDFQIVGLSALFNSSFVYLSDISTFIKQLNPEIYVIAGGGLPSAAYSHVLHHCPSIDAVCKGEGELPLLRILRSDDLSTACDHDESFVTRNSLLTGKIPKASYIFDLDEIPFLQYNRLTLSNYNSRSIDKRYTSYGLRRELSIHTSRGCPYKCVFCSNPSLHGHDVRFMSLQKVEREVVRMREEFAMTVLLVEDDHFFHNKNRAKDVLKIFAQNGIRVEFPNGMAVYAIDDEVAELLAIAGVSAAALAVESGSDYVLSKLMKKPLQTRFVRPAVDALRKQGIRAHAFIVAGIPGENDEHREETRQMLLSSNFDWVHIYCAIPIFGSRLFDICIENNYINLNKDFANFVATKSIIKTPEIDPETLSSWVYRTQIEVNFSSNCNLKLGCFDRALPYFENVVDKYPEHAFGRLLRGITLRELGEIEKSESDLLCAKRLFDEPEWSELARSIGSSAMRLLAENQIILKNSLK
jgi:anaerobic magnesium-protoporphyrin IX monomethyl ester cyclase